MADQANTVTDEEKAAAAKQDAETRRLVSIQLDESDKRRREEEDRRISGMTDQEFLRWRRERYGF
jgi:hypothetical protein